MVHLMFYSKPEDMKDLDITSSVEDQQFLEDLYKNPNFIKELEKLLPKLMHEGYMD